MQSDTTLSYDINMACTKKLNITNVCTNSSGGLTLAQGTVTVDASIISSSYNCCGDEDFIYTSTTKRADYSCAHIGETVTYTITFTNHSSTYMEMVCISDVIPENAVLEEGSITPAPDTSESLLTGITLYNIEPGTAVSLTYRCLIVSDVPKILQEHARTIFSFKDNNGCSHYGRGRSCSCIVQVVPGGRCLSDSNQRRYQPNRTIRCCPHSCKYVLSYLRIYDFAFFCNCTLDQTKTKYSYSSSNQIITTIFAINVQYIDRGGKKRNAIHYDCVHFFIPTDSAIEEIGITLSDLCYHSLYPGTIKTRIKAELSNIKG